jgi:arginine-tRNA-protein transferase
LEGCDACVSARVPARDYRFSRSERRILRRNDHLQRHLVEAEATREQFELLGRYLDPATRRRHERDELARLCAPWWRTPPRAPHRRVAQPSRPRPGRAGRLRRHRRPRDGCPWSTVSSTRRCRETAPASFAILDHIVQAQLIEIPYVYLGYWVGGSAKMDYKARFRPLEVLRYRGWTRLTDSERS